MLPDSEITSPRATCAPSATRSRELWRYVVVIPCPWSITSSLPFTGSSLARRTIPSPEARTRRAHRHPEVDALVHPPPAEDRVLALAEGRGDRDRARHRPGEAVGGPQRHREQGTARLPLEARRQLRHERLERGLLTRRLAPLARIAGRLDAEEQRRHRELLALPVRAHLPEQRADLARRAAIARDEPGDLRSRSATRSPRARSARTRAARRARTRCRTRAPAPG